MTLQQVHLRINDAATGQPTPVRLRITDADGRYYAPYGRLTEFATGVNQDVGGNVQIGAKKWAYIDGACEILLPPGKLHVEITKGPEYKPIAEEIDLFVGKMSMRYLMNRWNDSRASGWYSGDTRLHFLSPDAALLEGQAEDLAVVNLLAKETTITDQFGKVQKSIPNILSFSGQSYACGSPRCGVAVNTQNVHSVLGSLGLLHCHRIVYPLTFDDPGWVLDDWCGQCHRKKGLVVWTEPQHQTADFVYGEPLAHAVLGNVDAFELTFFEDSPFDALADYYKLLDAGIVLPLVGASGKGSNATPAGCMRTMAFLDSFEDRSYSTWIESVRKGQTYVSNGPILTFTDLPKPEQRTLAERVNIRYRVQAACLTPFEHFELLWNGAVLVDSRPSLINGVWRAEIEHELTPRESGWVACRCRGTALVSGGPAPQRIFAHSSATIVHMENAAPHCKPDAAQSLLGELDNLLRWAQRSQHVRLQHVVEEARTNFAKRLSSEQV